MDFSQTALIGMLRQKLAFLSERQAVLARNVANADTPGYKPEDLKPVDFGKLADKRGAPALAATHPGHVQGGDAGGRFARERQKDTFEATPTGNEVSLDEQVMKMAETGSDYQAATSIYRKMTEMMRVALGGN